MQLTIANMTFTIFGPMLEEATVVVIDSLVVEASPI